jgi:hypothetical protein
LDAEAAEAPRFLSDCHIWSACIQGELDSELPHLERQEQHMHATVRRYDGVDETRRDELTKKVNEALIPRLSKLPGFSGYYLVEAGTGVMTSISLFDSREHADESTRLAATWIRDEKLEGALPNPPKITFGEVIAQKTNGVVTAV